MSKPHPLPPLGATLIGLVLGAACASAQAQIFVGHGDAGGAVVLSNFRSDETPEVLVAAPPGPPPVATPAPAQPAAPVKPPARPGRSEIAGLVAQVAAQSRVSPRLLAAVIQVESNFDPYAVSPKGAMGLMQLMPETAQRFGASDPFSPLENLRAGAAYLKWLDGLFQGKLELVLAAYNAGEQAVLRAGRRIPRISETQAYVPRVLALLEQAELAPRVLR